MAVVDRPYIDLLRDPKWQRKRLEIMQRDDFRCRECRDTESNLQVHHKRYVRGRAPWEYDDSVLVTLCFRCHERITKLRARANDLLAEMNLYELPIIVSTMEDFWGSRSAPQTPAAPPAMERERDAAVIRASLERLEREKLFLLAQDFTPARSRLVETIDADIAGMWNRLIDQPGGAVAS